MEGWEEVRCRQRWYGRRRRGRCDSGSEGRLGGCTASKVAVGVGVGVGVAVVGVVGVVVSRASSSGAGHEQER